MTELNQFGNAKQYSCACAIDTKLSSDIEALLNIPTQVHYSYPVRMDDDNLSDIFGNSGPCRVGYKDAVAKAGIPHESIKDY